MNRSIATDPEGASAEATTPPPKRLAAVFAGGVAAGGGLALALLVRTGAQEATSTAFALGALVFGSALLGWAVAVVGGRGLEASNAYLETESEFTEAGARRAMLLLCAVGLGGMVGASLLAAVLA